ncbi:hypothetical protein EI94DRAFT_1590818 [Lactarius quietus]|nr:hypothetical protein EI94DRAFT_1590818 [Lactarius quietus]
MDVAQANDGDGGHNTPPSPFTDSSSSPTTFFASASTPTTDLTSLPSEASKPSLETVKRSPLGVPPAVTKPYSQASALDDIPGVAYALDLFLKSLMVESEEYCHTSDPEKERLYFATGFGLIQCVKGLMSFEDDDILSAIADTKHGNAVANEHRKKAASLPFRLASYVTGSSGSSSVSDMTTVERHAELVYAESLFEKASLFLTMNPYMGLIKIMSGLLGTIYSGDWLGFIKEALNMRSTMQVYRQLGNISSRWTPRRRHADKSVDVHFRSGVYLGQGMSNLLLSLIPGKLATLVELFGYKGDRHLGLALLQKAGGWTKESPEPSISQEDEGVRRSICDISLVMFHLFISGFTHDGVDVMMAQKVVEWNLKRYPEGSAFFLLAHGRLNACRSQPARAIASYQKAMSVQSQYRNLHHFSFWEMALSYLTLWELEESLKCWRNLQKEASWSKAVYTYGVAVSLIQLGGEENQAEAVKLLAQVPKLRQRIAGKSIPLEKYVARKARKGQAQGGRLLLPALELTYVFQAFTRTPRSVISERMLPLVDAAIAKLKPYEGKPRAYENGAGFWDDWCLARLLEGACLRYIAYPDPDALLDPDEVVSIPRAEAAKRACAAFEAVFANGPKVELDHFIVYYAHYEYGRLLACMGDKDRARTQLDLVLSGKHLEVNAEGRKGKYSLESDLNMRTNAAVEALEGDKRLYSE